MDFEYTVKRSAKRRKMTITVERDRTVIVHAPAGVSDKKIEEMVQAKRQWIYEKRRHGQKYSELPHAPGKELVNGESALYLGRNYRIEIVDDLDTVCFDHKFLIPKKQAGNKREALRDWYKLRAKEKILPRVERQAKVLGVDFRSAKIVDSRYRWGSCTVKDNVTFNWRLIKSPMFVIDYVVAHELAHLIEANHTRRFWNIVRCQVATMEKAKAWLKQNGQILDEDI